MDGRPDLIGYGFGAPIQPVLDRLQINILTAAAPGQEQVVSAMEGDPRPGGVVAMAERHEERALLLRAQDELLATDTGQLYAELARTHRPEVQSLINTNRRVAVAWQRNGGPLFFQLALNAVQHPDAAFPREVNGRPLDDSIANILKALNEHGSAPLRSDIAKFGNVWKLLRGMSFNELKSKVKHGYGAGTLELLARELARALAVLERRLAPDQALQFFESLGVQFPQELLGQPALHGRGERRRHCRGWPSTDHFRPVLRHRGRG